MRFTMVTYGTDGDTRPFVALSRGLMDAGHQVHLFAEQSSVGIARALSVPVDALTGEVRSILPQSSPREPLTRQDASDVGKNFIRLYNQNTEAWLHAITDEARDSDAILVSGLATYVGAAAGLELRKPWIGVWVLPITPTREFSMPMAPPMRLPGWANWLTFRALHEMTWHKFGKSANAARENLFGGPARARIKLDCPILYGISRHLVARPADWPDTHQICGQWPLPPPPDWQPPDKLREFLGAGTAPIYVGFGSPSGFIRQKHLDVLIEGIAGRRAVFYPGWSQIDATMLPKNFFVVRETPHAWLFPQCSVIIHHGGAGTTHTSARAGVPSIVTPFAADQFFWASRLAAAGVAPKYVRRSDLDAQSLAAMIEFSQQDKVRTCAKRLSEAMSQENGVGDAVRRIEMLMSRQSVG